MITQELYFKLLEEAADLCGKDHPDQAIAVLTKGGISQRAAQEKVGRMMEVGDEIRERQKRDRELLDWRDGGADGKRCIVLTTNGDTPAQASKEADYIWETIVKKALVESHFTPVYRRGMDQESPLAVQAIGKADLLVMILTEKAQELGWVVSLAQAWDKPVVPLAAKGSDWGLTLPLASPPIHYTCRQTGEGFAVDDSDSLVERVKGRIVNPRETADEPSFYDIAREIYRQPLRIMQARYLRDAVCRGKLRTLHQFYRGLEDALERLMTDYKLKGGASADTLSPFADILTETAATFRNDYQCLHEAMKAAVGTLPQPQQDESLKVCEAMKILLHHTLNFIRALQIGDAVIVSKENREQAIKALEDEIRKCCQLIPDREVLVKSTGPVFDDPLTVTGSNMEVLLRKAAVEAVFEKLIEQPTPGNAKAFCRAIRFALLRWLGLDRREPGAADEAAQEIQSFGAQVIERFAQNDNPGQVGEVYEAVRDHVARFKERLDVTPEQRAAKDYDELVKFVEDCQE